RLHFPSGSARQIADSRLSFGPDDTQRFFQQFVLQITEPITMRLRRRLFQEPAVDNLCVERSSVVSVACNHVDHLIVAGIAQGFIKCPMGKRRAKNQRVEMPSHVTAVKWLQVWAKAVRGALKLFKKDVNG